MYTFLVPIAAPPFVSPPCLPSIVRSLPYNTFGWLTRTIVSIHTLHPSLPQSFHTLSSLFLSPRYSTTFLYYWGLYYCACQVLIFLNQNQGSRKDNSFLNYHVSHLSLTISWAPFHGPSTIIT